VPTFSFKLKKEVTMSRTVIGLSVVGSVIYGIASAANVSASPLSAMGGVSHMQANGVQAVDYRRCWWSDGRRVCRYVYGYRGDDWRFRHRHRWWW
jgi:hypothetical protein